jgi:16S rRNA (cytosine967-C5)-methyltransferase
MDARSTVTWRIADQARRFPDLDLQPLDTGSLAPRDAALAGAIEHAVLRRWLTLVTVLQSQLSRPWEDVEHKLQAVLLVGAAQLLLLDRVPDHAVINEAVRWAKSNIRAKAGGFVNAVLRRVAALRISKLRSDPTAVPPPRNVLPLHDGQAWTLESAVFDEYPIRRLAQQTSHPETLLMRWLGLFGQEATLSLAMHSLVHAPILMHGKGISTLGTDAAPLLEPHQQRGFHVFHGRHEELLALLRDDPSIIVQDPASAAPVQATVNRPDLRQPALIIDACAGRGTKTRQLAAVHPSSRIIATDRDKDRVSALRESVKDLANVEVIAHETLSEFARRADLVVLDVPCSNTGVLARRVEAKYRFSQASLEAIVALQRQIIADSLGLLRDQGGLLLYATCSIEPAENQQQAQWITKWHPLGVMTSETRMPRGTPGEPAATYADGGYFALLRRQQT